MLSICAFVMFVRRVCSASVGVGDSACVKVVMLKCRGDCACYVCNVEEEQGDD